MRRREFIALVGSAVAAWPLAVYSQQARALQVGFLYPGPEKAASPRVAAVVSGLEAGGLLREQFEILSRAADGAPILLGSMAADLVERNVDLIIAVSPIAVRACQTATKTIPIVAGDLESDPVASGFVRSIGKPGGNITGMFLDFPDFCKKLLQVLREAVPPGSTVAIFWDPGTGPAQLEAVKAAAKELETTLVISEVRNEADVRPALQTSMSRYAGGLLILSSPYVGANTKTLAKHALASRLPAITLFPDFARDGGLMAYGPDLLGYFRQQGVMAAKILEGATVGDMPVEAPTKFEFVLNAKTARELGIKLPPSMLIRADEVIE